MKLDPPPTPGSVADERAKARRARILEAIAAAKAALAATPNPSYTGNTPARRRTKRTAKQLAARRKDTR